MMAPSPSPLPIYGLPGAPSTRLLFRGRGLGAPPPPPWISTPGVPGGAPKPLLSPRGGYFASSPTPRPTYRLPVGPSTWLTSPGSRYGAFVPPKLPIVPEQGRSTFNYRPSRTPSLRAADGLDGAPSTRRLSPAGTPKQSDVTSTSSPPLPPRPPSQAASAMHKDHARFEHIFPGWKDALPKV